MDLRRIATILLRRWWLVLGMPALVLGISLILLSTSPYVASMRVSVLIPGDTQATGTAERPELMVLDDIPQIVSSPAFANAVSAQLQQTSPQYALTPDGIQASLSADYYSRIVTIRATRDDEQEALALLDAVRLSFENQVDYFLIADGGQPATVRFVAPPTASRDSPATGTVALVIQTLVALAIGCGLAALAAAFDPRIHTRSDAAAAVPVPVLGDLRPGSSPGVRWRPRRRRTAGADGSETGSGNPDPVDGIPTEALRALRVTLEATGSDGEAGQPPCGRVWLVAGVDGDAAIASALGRGLGRVGAAAGERWLVLDAARLPVAAGDAGEPGESGESSDAGEPGESAGMELSAWLAGDGRTLSPLPAPDVGGAVDALDIRAPDDGRDVMRGPRWEAALCAARAAYDVILVVIRPVASSADALALAGHVDGIVLLVVAGRTGGSALVQARAALQAAGGRIVGTVLVPADR